MLELKLLGIYKQVNGESKVPFLSYSYATRLRGEDGKKENVIGSLASNVPLILGAGHPESGSEAVAILRAIRKDEATEEQLARYDGILEEECELGALNLGCWFVAENLEWVVQTETKDPDGYGERVMDKRDKKGNRVGNFERESLTKPVKLVYAGEGGGIQVDMTGAPGVL